MITDTEYMQIVSETYDLSDYATKKNLLFCNEAKRIDNLEHIVGNLYMHIKSNVAGIDFGTIPKSKGVVTRIDNYANVLDCINSVHELVYNYKERTDIPDALSTALANLQQRERVFTKAFALNIEFPIMIYNMTVLAVVSSVSLLLSSTVEYVKNGHDSFAVSFDKTGYTKSRDHVLYQYVTQFNRNCDNGTLDKLMNDCIKNNLTPMSESADLDYIEEGLLGSAVAAGAAIKNSKQVMDAINTIKNSEKIAKAAGTAVKIGKAVAVPAKWVAIIIAGGYAIYMLVKALAKLIFWCMKTQTKISDWFEIQATYLQINAENLKYRDDRKDSDDHRKKVYRTQMWFVDKFKKIANALALKDSKATKETEEEERRNRNQRYEDDGYDDGESLF